MSLLKSKTAKAFVGFVTLAVVLAFVAVPTERANGQTIEELLNLIAQLQEQISQLTGGTTGGGGEVSGIPAGFQFTIDRTDGSTGTDVMYLQMYLNSRGNLVASTGAGSPGQETQYFGNLTKSALAAYQAAQGISPAVGYFGQITRANVNAQLAAAPAPMPMPGLPEGCTSTEGFSITTGMPCSGGGQLPAGCLPGYMFSPTTGEACDGSESESAPSTSGDLEGTGAGSVSEYQRSSSWTNEQVGEEEIGQTIVGLEIEADDNSDLEISALKVDFDQSTGATAEFDKYADSVVIMHDGEEFGRVDASEFDDDNGYNKTITLDSGLIVRAGERITVEVAVDGVANIDTTEAGDTWNVDIESVRWRDHQGTVIAEDPSVAETGHTYETFATATNVEFKILGNDRDDLNLAHLIDVHATADTDDVEVFSFDVRIDGDSDVELDDLLVEATVTGASDLFDIADQAHLYVDGDNKDSVTVTDGDDTVTFDDINLDLVAGTTYEFIVSLDLRDLADTLDEGDTLSFTIGETETDATAFDVKDENGDQLADDDKTGTVTSSASAFFDTGINLSLVGNPTATLNADGNGGNDDDQGLFEMVFDITAFGGTVFVGDTAAATIAGVGDGAITDAIIYHIYDDGTVTAATTLSDTVTFTTGAGVTDSTDNIQINEGATSRVTLAVLKTNDGGPDSSGLHYMDLAGIAWGVADDTTYENMFSYDLTDWKTNTIAMD